MEELTARQAGGGPLGAGLAVTGASPVTGLPVVVPGSLLGLALELLGEAEAAYVPAGAVDWHRRKDELVRETRGG